MAKKLCRKRTKNAPNLVPSRGGGERHITGRRGHESCIEEEVVEAPNLSRAKEKGTYMSLE